MDMINGIKITLGMGVPICITVAFLIHAISVTLNKGRCK
jgi:hypothetical protein